MITSDPVEQKPVLRFRLIKPGTDEAARKTLVMKSRMDYLNPVNHG